jgi:RNA polymerase sigma factor (sigma-70 family)
VGGGADKRANEKAGDEAGEPAASGHMNTHGTNPDEHAGRDVADRRVVLLLARMRAGERAAISEFILAYAPLIRGRLRQHISADMRGFFDSMDLVSTVARRFDTYAARNAVRFDSVEDLFGLLFKIARASCADKARLHARLQRVEGPDSEIARLIGSRLRGIHRSGRGDITFEVEELLARLPTPDDAELVRMWLAEKSFADIGNHFGIPEKTARQRWRRLRPVMQRVLTELAEV